MFGPLNVFRSLPEASSTHSATAQQSPQGRQFNEGPVCSGRDWNNCCFTQCSNQYVASDLQDSRIFRLLKLVTSIYSRGGTRGTSYTITMGRDGFHLKNN